MSKCFKATEKCIYYSTKTLKQPPTMLTFLMASALRKYYTQHDFDHLRQWYTEEKGRNPNSKL